MSLKLERINEKQIKCTISKEDLQQRQILPSDLRYGSTATKRLFNEVLKSAKEQFNFTQDNDALTIEAVPSNDDSIDILITKDTFPDELDTRFAEFSKTDIAVPVVPDGEEAQAPTFDPSELYKSYVNRRKGKVDKTSSNAEETAPSHNLFVFESMDDLINVAKVLNKNFHGESSLTRFADTNELILDLVYKTSPSSKIDPTSAILADFDTPVILNEPAKAAIKEHGEIVIHEDAVKILASL
ncbi:MAG: adaptor protein MecA [Lachnospiraceae bacterium]|nr:adaptor protein MecA [Lachnospiraceae bacterium]